MKETYKCENFRADIKKWWLLLLLGIISAIVLTFLLNEKYKGVAIIYVKNANIYNIENKNEEIALYKLRFSQIAKNIHPIIIPIILKSEKKKDELGAVNENLQVIENIEFGTIKLIYSSKSKKDAEAMVNKIAEKSVSYLSSTLDRGSFSIQKVKAIKDDRLFTRKKIEHAILGGILGGMFTIGFIMFLEFLISIKNSKI